MLYSVFPPNSTVAYRRHAGAFLTVPIISVGPGRVKPLKMKFDNQQIPLGYKRKIGTD